MAGLTLPGRCAPTNLRLSPSVRTRMVDSDMYDICERIKEIDPSFFIIDLEDDDTHSYAIMGVDVEGTEYLIKRYEVLDARILHDLQRIAKIPMEERLKVLMAEDYRFKAEQHENEMEQLYENIGRPMWTQFEHDGFISQRGVSYPKKGVVGKKRL